MVQNLLQEVHVYYLLLGECYSKIWINIKLYCILYVLDYQVYGSLLYLLIWLLSSFLILKNCYMIENVSVILQYFNIHQSFSKKHNINIINKLHHIPEIQLLKALYTGNDFYIISCSFNYFNIQHVRKVDKKIVA